VDQFFDAAKQAYVKAAMSDLLPSGSRPNISRLAVATGLTRKEVSVLVETAGGRVFPPRRAKEQRATRVLRGWCVDPRFHDKRGQPAQLSLRGGERAFTQLVRLYGGDVTPLSVLRELERMNAISTTKDGLVRLRASARRLPLHLPQRMLEIANLFTDFAHVIASGQSNSRPQRFFGYRECESASTDDISLFNRTFSRRATALLDSFDQWHASRRNALPNSSNSRRVGIGIYLVNDGAPSDGSRRKSQRQRRSI
jgi:hypothetical protein